MVAITNFSSQPRNNRTKFGLFGNRRIASSNYGVVTFLRRTSPLKVGNLVAVCVTGSLGIGTSPIASGSFASTLDEPFAGGH